jgi:hypothetical protein
VEIITLLEDEDYHDEYLARVIMNDRTLRVKRADLWANHIKGGRDTEKYRRAWGIINWPKDD